MIDFVRHKINIEIDPDEKKVIKNGLKNGRNADGFAIIADGIIVIAPGLIINVDGLWVVRMEW